VVPVTLRRTNGIAQPDSVIVEVFAFRPSQATVPGSGQRFIVRFQ
jgi:protein involved in polysaccharide export with SLBB domain